MRKISKSLIIISVILIPAFIYTSLAAPPSSPYSLGETLAPTCSPGDANCTVDSPQTSHAYLSDISNISASQGDIVYFDGTDWVNLGAATSGRVLITQGSGGNPVWGSNLYWDNANGRLGIGTASPFGKLSIIDGNIDSGNTFYGNYSYFKKTTTGNLYGQYLTVDNSESTSPGSNMGVYSIVKYSGTGTISSNKGAEFISDLHSNGNLTTSRGIQVQSRNNFAGTISDLVVFRGIASSGSSGNIGNLSLVRVDFTGSGGSGTVDDLKFFETSGSTFAGNVTASYGLYMDTTIDMGTSTAYAIYSSSVSDSYLQGKLGVATSSPATALDVDGGIRADRVTSDPCGANFPEGVLFYNDTSDYYCFCNGSGDDIQIFSTSTACF